MIKMGASDAKMFVGDISALLVRLRRKRFTQLERIGISREDEDGEDRRS
jgi:hypothetical protein